MVSDTGALENPCNPSNPRLLYSVCLTNSVRLVTFGKYEGRIYGCARCPPGTDYRRQDAVPVLRASTAERRGTLRPLRLGARRNTNRGRQSKRHGRSDVQYRSRSWAYL